MRNYLSEMLYALTSAYTRKDYTNRQRAAVLETSIGKLFSIFAWGLDTVQEQADAIRLWDDLDYAKGAVLDRYGANFGVRRFGAGDTFYRLAIKVKLLSQLSGGDIETVLDAAATLFGVTTDKIALTELFPAKVQIELNEMDIPLETLEIAPDIAEMIKRILAAGVGLIIMLKNSREFKSDLPIVTALFTTTHTEFTLQDARRRFEEPLPVVVAGFAHTRVFVNLLSANRTTTQDLPVKPALFEYARVAVNSVYREESAV